MDVEQFDVVVLGAGPGGYVSAIRCSQLGLKTAIIERNEVGGICLNWGCIPSKSLLKNAQVLALVRQAEEFGISFDNLRIDYSKAHDRSRDVVSKLTKGVAHLLSKNKVESIKGVAKIENANRITVLPDNRILEAANIIIATGARPKTIPNLPIDREIVITSREALALRELPSNMLIVGGGATGVEFAYLCNSYGTKVSLVEVLPHLLPNEDPEISQHLERTLENQGVEILTGSKVVSMITNKNSAQVQIERSGNTLEFSYEKVLVAIGVQANIEELELQNAGINTTSGFIDINTQMATNVPNIYAIGDVTGKLLLAHVASTQGIIAAESIAGLNPQTIDYINMPKATYSNPQVASFGLTESQARDQGYSVKTGKFPFQANGKALALGEPEGMVKLVVDAEFGEILGAHMIGSDVTELLAELSMTKMLEGTTSELGSLTYAHPTMSEALKEAALVTQGKGIHI